MNILVIDNYDSFTYNLVHMLEKLMGQGVRVLRNDEVTDQDVVGSTALVISPGPGLPSEAGRTLDIIRRYGSEKKILGVCLGHQAIQVAFGGYLTNLDRVHHGVAHAIHVLEDDYLFRHMPAVVDVGRYHSWVNAEPVPAGFVITARDQDGEIMAMRHHTLRMHSVQFHPESVLTPQGEQMLSNWLEYC